jgi:putative addiction module component (TIGR02574 family)
MNEQTRAAFEAALSLAPEHRAALAEALLDSLSEDQEAADDGELLAELNRRRADADRGGNPIPWSTLRDEG